MRTIKNNKYFILCIFILICLICYSFYEFYKENFSYKDTYYKIEKVCYNENKLDDDLCKYFRTTDDVKRYLDNNDPNVIWKKYDVITLTSTIVEQTLFSSLQFFSPLIIAIAVIGTLHSEYSSGMFENFLLRMDYKKYLKKKYSIVLRSALIMPFALLFVFLISCLITNFNFDFSNIDKQLTVFSAFKYNHFLIYGIIILLIQFFISLFYANLSLLFCIKHKNKLVAIIMSYVGFLITYLFIYIVLYILILNKLFGLKEMTDFFSITGYWFFRESEKSYIALIISIVLQLISFFVVYLCYKNKDGVIKSYEKQTS